LASIWKSTAAIVIVRDPLALGEFVRGYTYDRCVTIQ
jgi:hypothetical protein